METKKLIRDQVLQLRDGLSPIERLNKSRQIWGKIVELQEYIEAEEILIYVNFKSEVDTEGLILQSFIDGKQVYCPKVNGDTMDFYRIFSLDDLVVSYKGIREPLADNRDSLDKMPERMPKPLVIMPGSAFDTERNRIGYGKGYYDRYLQENPQMVTLAVCFDCQIVQKVPMDVYDIKPDILVTEKEIYTDANR